MGNVIRLPKRSCTSVQKAKLQRLATIMTEAVLCNR